MGELQTEPFQFTFNGFLKVAFQGSRVTSDAGLILVRELDERLGLERIIAAHLRDWCRVASTTCCSRAAVICRFRPLPGASRRNASGTSRRESPPPQPDGVLARVELPRDVRTRHPTRGQQDDSTAEDQPLRRGAGAQPALQRGTLLVGQRQYGHSIHGREGTKPPA